jgi:hypothetical protein
MSRYQGVVSEDDQGNQIITFDPEMMKELGWKEGDTLNWKDNGNGTFSISKVADTEWVLVETISMFRMRYMIEVPKGHSVYALDDVTMGVDKELSQQHLGETIVSHRVVSLEEALKVSREDNEYLASWSDEQHIKKLFISLDDQKKSE